MKFWKINFRGINKKEVLKEDENLKLIYTVNTEFILLAQENEKFLTILNKGCCTIDGQLPYWIIKFLSKNKELEKISGSDFIFDLCKFAQTENKKIFLLGGIEESNKKAIELLKNKFKVEISGFSPEYQNYPFNEKFNNEIIETIEKFKPEILLVAFGAPKQEYWLHDNRKELEKIGVKYGIGVGGTFDFISGRIKRAPLVIQRIGMEWLWRLIQQPKLRYKRIIRLFRIFMYKP